MSSSSSNLLALGFGNLGILFWLAAVGLPLLIHLWNRRKHREEPFAAVAFILSAVQRHAHRIRIQHWLLLALRTAIVLLIVLAVAEPYVESLGVDIVSRKRTHKLLVIDGSYSMAYRPVDNSRFRRAKQLAADIVRQSTQGDGYTLILMGEPPQIIVGRPAFDANDFISEVNNLPMPHAGADLTQTLTKIDEVLTRTRRDHPDLEQSQVIFLTDLGANTWQPANEELRSLEARRKAYSHLAEIASLIVIDLGQPDWDNQMVSQLRMNQPYATTTEPVSFEVMVRGSGAGAQEKAIEFLVDGQKIKKEQISVPAEGEMSLHFTHKFLEAGSHVVEARLATDQLETDNHCWLAINVRSHLRVLCVQGDYDAAHYLRRALAPIKDETAVVQVNQVAESELIEQDLDQFDCVFLCNVAQFTRAEARLLRRYVRSGGGLVFFLGDRVVAERYNRELSGSRAAQERVLPVSLIGPTDEGAYQFDPLGYSHPVVAPFRGREQAGLLTTPVSRYYRLAALDSAPTARVALAFNNGDPAIVEDTIGRGRVFVIAIPSFFGRDKESPSPWTLFPAWPSFLPVVQEILSSVITSGDEHYHTQVGDPIGMIFSDTSQNASVSLTSPDDQRLTVSTTSDPHSSGWTFADTSTSGVYTAKLGPPLGTTQRFAVNVDTRESDLTKASIEKLPKTLRVQTRWQNLGQDSQTAFIQQSGLHRWFIYAVMTLLFVELSLAWYFGRAVA